MSPLVHVDYVHVDADTTVLSQQNQTLGIYSPKQFQQKAPLLCLGSRIGLTATVLKWSKRIAITAKCQNFIIYCEKCNMIISHFKYWNNICHISDRHNALQCSQYIVIQFFCLVTLYMKYIITAGQSRLFSASIRYLTFMIFQQCLQNVNYLFLFFPGFIWSLANVLSLSINI